MHRRQIVVLRRRVMFYLTATVYIAASNDNHHAVPTQPVKVMLTCTHLVLQWGYIYEVVRNGSTFLS